MTLAGACTPPTGPAAFALVSPPPLLLRPFPIGGYRSAVRTEATCRVVVMWRVGRLKSPYAEAVAESTARRLPGGPRAYVVGTTRLAASLVRDGNYGRAAALAESHGLLAQTE